jgi:HD-like signal output (HDOD) protein
MDRKTIEAAIERTESLPTLPAARERLSTALDNPDYTYRDIGRIVGVDVILSARVLAQANASRRSPATPVTTIPQAVRLAGFDALGVLLRSQSALSALETRPRVGEPFPLRELWRHALATALAARAIGVQVGYAEPDELYAAALLHDLGKHALWQLVPDRFDTMVSEARRDHATFYNREVESNEPSHAVVGRLLAKRWSLPAGIVAAIGYHHTPQLAVEHPKIVAAVHIADMLARTLGLGSGGDPFAPPIKPAALHTLALGPVSIRPLLTRLEAEYAAMVSLLNTPQDSHAR